jgi:multisubunit Na+/H+ antiporter MnhC subunit
MIKEIFKLIIGLTIIAMMCVVFLYYGGYYG